MNKELFLEQLKNGLSDFPENVLADILFDYKQRFESELALGKSEIEIIEELGNPNDIIKQYRDGQLKKYETNDNTEPDYTHSYANNFKDNLNETSSFIYPDDKHISVNNKKLKKILKLVLSVLIGFITLLLFSPLIVAIPITTITVLASLTIAIFAIIFGSGAILAVKLGINVVGLSTIPTFITNFPNSTIIFAALGCIFLTLFFWLCFYYLNKVIFKLLRKSIMFISNKIKEVI